MTKPSKAGAVCHKCCEGFDPNEKDWYMLEDAEGDQLWFCDGDCLRKWVLEDFA